MKNDIRAYASRLTGARVDFEKRMIYGIVVMTVGKAFGHAAVDATTLEQFAVAVGAEKVRGREDHPDENLLGKSGLTKKVEDLRGYFFNLRIEGEKLLADFQALSEQAAGEAPTRLLFKAHEAPEIFGVSPVFFGTPEKNVARVSKVAAIDFVDIPAGDDANQQLFKGVGPVKFSISKNSATGKYSVKCDEDGKEYDADFPGDAEEKKKSEMAAEEEKKKAAMAAEEEEKKKDEDKKKAEMAALGAKTFSAQDVEAARLDGEKKARAYSAEFDAVMDASGFKGDARDTFRADFFELGDIKLVKRFASERVAMRAKAVGSEHAEAANKAETEAVNRFCASQGVRTLYGCMSTDKESAEWKKALAQYVKEATGK